MFGRPDRHSATASSFSAVEPPQQPADGVSMNPVSEVETHPGERSLADIASRLDELTGLFRRRLLNDTHGREVTAELRKRASLDETVLVGRILRPVAVRLLNVIDRVDGWDGEPDPFADSLRDEILQILADFGVEEIMTDGVLDSRRHRVEATMPSSQPEGDILECRVRGFQLDDRVLRPAGVIVSAGLELASEPGAAEPNG